MEEQKQKQNNQVDFINNSEPADLSSPDFSQIKEKPKKTRFKKYLFLALKIISAIVVLLIIVSAVLGIIYYQNFKKAYELGFAAKADAEEALHEIINRKFSNGAELIEESNQKLDQAKELLDQVPVIRYIPYLKTQVKAVDNLLIAGVNLTESGAKVVWLMEDIFEPLHNESITYTSITLEQKKAILNKLVESEELLYEVKDQIDIAVAAIEDIPDTGLIGPLKENVDKIKDTLPLVKNLVDYSLPMIKVVPKIAGFDQPKTYLFLFQNNSELRPTGGFIGTYGILKIHNGEMVSFETDNIYNLDRAPQYILQEEAPAPIAKYLEQKYWSLRDINWSPDFPTTAEKALYMYDKEYEILQSLK